MAARPDEFVSVYDLLVTHLWWEYQPGSLLSEVYHFWNIVEGVAWFVFAGLVAARWFRFRKSWLEVAYAVAFVAFGVSDFREAYRLESWLLLVKGANLFVLLWLRSMAIRRWYPGSKVY